MTVLLCTCLGLLFSFLHFNAAADVHEAKQTALVGEHVTFPCNNKVPQTNCSKTTWLYIDNTATELVTHGKIRPRNSERAKRMSLKSDCSLHINDITDEDEGCYTCQQYPEGGGSQLTAEARICLTINKGNTTDKNDKLLMIVIPSMLLVISLSVAAVIAFLTYRMRAQQRTSVVNQNNICHEHSDGEDVVTYTELNHNIVIPRKVDIDKEYQKTEYAVVKLS
ncbi:uncharacterized protein LOC127416472 isoform X1 [Myxocyprinus asiaticus]|uniref:uncharacterized protein LOC127416472 isoform X1 n=1 Tax=Myxocyprinus asiaticus TaxID=70543 RepID=UPI002221BAEA|nr:uncharacterized protein LOC127416472 isoform X1 [Myxocyprinus asiaticus]